MRTPAAALAWEFWGRHRWGLAAVGVLVAGFAVAVAASPFKPNMAMAMSVWFAIGLLYAIGVFAYGFEARLETPDSGFPVRLFLLPVRTTTLVGWPMLQGVAVAVGLWLAWDHFVLRPCGVETPAWWVAMIAAAVAGGQALLWCPFGLPWLRLAVACVFLTLLSRAPAMLELIAPSLGEVGTWATRPENRGTALVSFGGAVVALAFLFAWIGVGRARRGDSPDWLRAWRSRERSTGPVREGGPFATAMRAQAWYEWRLRGRGYVVTVLIITLSLAGLGLLAHESQRADFALMFLFVPALIASLWGSQMGSPGESLRSSALATFAATRPLSDADLVRAKVRAATRAAATAWAVVVGLGLVWLALHDNGYERMESFWDGAVEKYGRDRALGHAVLWLVALTFLTRRGLTANLWVGLSGRTWLVPTHTVLVTLFGLQWLLQWPLIESDAALRERFWAVLPWVAGVAVVLKFSVGAWALRAGVRRRLLEPGDALRSVALWAAAAGTLFALLVRFGSHLGSWPALAVAAVLLVPLARPSAAPLALAWNRHR